MKTYTLEELKAAQAKGCRIEWKGIDNDWRTLNDSTPSYLNSLKYGMLRIHPDDEWKARLPRLREGAEWACVMTERVDGFRPLVVGELVGGGPDGSPALKGYGFLTNRPVPPEFLHPDETTLGNTAAVQAIQLWEVKQPEAAQAPDFGEPWDFAEWNHGVNRNPGYGLLSESRHLNITVHTKEPDGFKDKDCTEKAKKDAARIIACVNALAGVADPAEFVRQAKENVERLADIERRQQAETIMQNHLDSHL